MSRSEQRAKKRQLFTEEYCQKTKTIPFVTSDGVEFHIHDAFICPTCMNIINVKDTDKITLEDVPPESVGGKPILVTCAKCNNGMGGGKLDCYLHNELLVYHLIKHPENTTYKATFTLNGVKIKGRARLEINSGKPKWHFTIDANDRVNYSNFREELENNWDGCNLQVDFNITSTKRMDEYSNISILRSAYLMAFVKMGYMYILPEHLDKVREQIQNRDKNILGSSYLVGREIDMMPEEIEGVYYGIVNDVRCVLIIMNLQLKEKYATIHKVVVALPNPGESAMSLYSKLEKMEATKTVSIISEVGQLPIKPIRTAEKYDEIFVTTKIIEESNG